MHWHRNTVSSVMPASDSPPDSKLHERKAVQVVPLLRATNRLSKAMVGCLLQGHQLHGPLLPCRDSPRSRRPLTCMTYKYPCRLHCNGHPCGCLLEDCQLQASVKEDTKPAACSMLPCVRGGAWRVCTFLCLLTCNLSLSPSMTRFFFS